MPHHQDPASGCRFPLPRTSSFSDTHLEAPCSDLDPCPCCGDDVAETREGHVTVFVCASEKCDWERVDDGA